MGFASKQKFDSPSKNFDSHEGDAGGLLHRKLPANPPQTNDVVLLLNLKTLLVLLLGKNNPGGKLLFS